MTRRSQFSRVPLSQHVFFQEGPGLRQWQWASEGMKVINVTNILGDGSVDISNTDKFISLSEYEDRYRHFAVEVGDIVVASSGNTYGKAGRISAEHLPLMMNTSVIRFHPLNEEHLSAHYLYAFLRSPDFKNQVEQFVTGGAQPNFGPSHLRQMSLPMPAIGVQRQIGETVAAYDVLIENNRRRIQLLEESARLLYREWFVHLRFPGHEDVQVVDGVPKGWDRFSIGELTSYLNRGITPKYDDAAPGLVINQKCVRNRLLNLELARRQSKEVPTEKLVRFGDVLINSTGEGTLGRVAQVISDIANCTVDSHVTIARPNDRVGTFQFGMSLCALEAVLTGMGRGATNQTELSRSDVAALELLVPNKIVGDEFEAFAKDVFQQIACLDGQNKKLAQARDLLLPRLMSGEIAV